MVSGINSIEQSVFQPQLSQRQVPTSGTSASPNSFDIEDKAIISAEAKLQNELEKFNAGGDNLVDLALAEVTSKITVAAEVNVIKTKKDMLDDISNMGN